MLYGQSHVRAGLYHSANSGSGGGGTSQESTLSVAYNPGGILLIEEGSVPEPLDLSSQRLPLPDQFNKLLSPKNTRLSRDPEFLLALRPFEESLRRELATLNATDFVRTCINPILAELSSIATRLEDLEATQDEVAFTRISEQLIGHAEHLEALERALYRALSGWAGESSGMADATSSGAAEELSFDLSAAEDFVNSLMNGGNTFAHLAQHTEAQPVDFEIRKAFAAIINHRLGNIPGLTAELMTYYGPDSWHYADEVREDRKRMPHVIAVKEHFLTYLQLFVEHASQANFYTLVEWAQFRLRAIPRR